MQNSKQATGGGQHLLGLMCFQEAAETVAPPFNNTCPARPCTESQTHFKETSAKPKNISLHPRSVRKIKLPGVPKAFHSSPDSSGHRVNEFAPPGLGVEFRGSPVDGLRGTILVILKWDPRFPLPTLAPIELFLLVTA